MYLDRYGWAVIVSWCWGCVRFIMGENCFAKCWYSGCNLMVHSMKYVLHLFLCVDGCVWRILGMGPGLVSMSPLSNIKKCRENVWIVRGFGRALCLCLLLLRIILWICFVMCFGCLRGFFFVFVW
jgi:hypothetical protein